MKTLHKSLASQDDRILIDFQAENSFQESFPFPTASVSGKKVRVDFRGGSVSSNAGVLLLRETERQVGIIASVVDCIADNRRQYSVEHSIKELVTQRVFQIACGDEDAEDCNALRVDPVLKMAVGRLPEGGADLASQPTMSRLENTVSRATLLRIGYALVDGFIASYSEEPRVIVIDFDDTDNIVYGNQQESLFNSYHGDYCYMPLHVYEGLSGKLITTVLRPGKRPDGKETLSYLKRIVTRIRQSWKEAIILFRGDGHYSSPEVFDWIRDQDKVYSVIGLSANEVLKRAIEPIVRELRQCHAQYKRPVKRYHSFSYQAGSWSEARRVVAKVELSEKGLNIRFISTEIMPVQASVLYKKIYCARGNVEGYIKDHKTYLHSDRSSCHRFEANQFRLFLHSLAYVLLHTLKTQVLRGTEFAAATMETLRLKLLKVGARVIELKTQIKLHLPTAYPYKQVFRRSLAIFSYLRKMERVLVPI